MRSYFFKVKYGDTGKSHWLFGRYENKSEVCKANEGAFEILNAKQLIEKYPVEEIQGITRNVLLYQPHVKGEFPKDILEIIG